VLGDEALDRAVGPHRPRRKLLLDRPQVEVGVGGAPARQPEELARAEGEAILVAACAMTASRAADLGASASNRTWSLPAAARSAAGKGAAAAIARSSSSLRSSVGTA